MRACVFFSHLSHLLSLLSVYLPFSLLSVLFSLLSLGASLARFARELSDTLLCPLFYVFFSLFLSCGRSGGVVRCFFELVGAPWALWGALGKLFESSQGVFGSSFASLFELSVSRHTLGALIFRI